MASPGTPFSISGNSYYGTVNEGDVHTINATYEIRTYSIDGSISDGSNPVQGVTVSFSNGGGNAISNASGVYSITVNHGYSGTGTPGLADYNFTPASRNYSSVTSNHTSQDYTATLNTYTLTFQTDGNGTLSGSTTQIIASGSDATAVTANDTTSHVFVDWTAPGGFTSTDRTLTVSSVSETKTYTANYTRPIYTVFFQHDGSGDLTGTLSQAVARGIDATAVTANDTSNYEFVNWTAPGGFTSTDRTLTITEVSGSKIYTAN